MNYTHYDLGKLSKGSVVEVTLQGNAANVQLLDHANFDQYKNGRPYQYIGGLAKQSPIRLQTPHSSRWHIAIDLRGMVGNVQSSVRVLPTSSAAVNPGASSTAPSPLPGNNPLPACAKDMERIYDVFIAYASEDKDCVARPLAAALKEKGLSVWFDAFELSVGDSLHQKLDLGLTQSKLGIVVISRDFVKKGWTDYELERLISDSAADHHNLLPMWHNIMKQEVISFSPTLAEHSVINTAINTIAEMADAIAQAITNW